MKSYFSPLYLCLILIFIASCDSDLFTNEITIDNLDFEPQLNIIANYNIGDTLFHILATKTVNIDENEYIDSTITQYYTNQDGSIDSVQFETQVLKTPKIDVIVTLYDESNEMVFTHACRSCNRITIPIDPQDIRVNENYKLEVSNSELGVAIAYAQASDQFEIELIDARFINGEVAIDIDITDANTNDDNFIFTGQHKDQSEDFIYDVYYFSRNENVNFFDISHPLAYTALSDDAWNNRSLRISLAPSTFSYGCCNPDGNFLYFKLDVTRIGENYFKLVKSLNDISVSEDNPFVEPVSIYNSFENAIGAFDLSYKKSIDITLEYDDIDF